VIGPILRILARTLVSLWVAAGASAATLRVGPGEEITTIQGGVDRAATGDTVLVMPATYVEHVVSDKGLTLLAGGGRR